jgi:putative flippase GtrA
VFNTAFHTAIAVTMIRSFGSGVMTANVVAFACATAVSYLINTLWSFARIPSGVTLVRFFAVSLLGAAIAAGVAHTAEILGAHYLVGIGCVALSVAPITYLLHRHWTYRKSPAP